MTGLHQVGWEDVPVLAAETKGTASFAAAVKAGKIVTLESIDSIATSLGARRVAKATLSWIHRHNIIPWTVSDRSAVNACTRFADDHRVLVEPACGAALAAVYERARPIKDKSSILAIVCGGSGVTLEKLREWKHQV